MVHYVVRTGLKALWICFAQIAYVGAETNHNAIEKDNIDKSKQRPDEFFARANLNDFLEAQEIKRLL